MGVRAMSEYDIDIVDSEPCETLLGAFDNAWHTLSSHSNSSAVNLLLARQTTVVVPRSQAPEYFRGEDQVGASEAQLLDHPAPT